MSKKNRLVDLNMKVPFEIKQKLYEISDARTKKEGKRISIASVAREVLYAGFKNFTK